MKLDELKAQLATTENDMEQAKAAVYRCDGAIQILQHLIKEEQEIDVVEAISLTDTKD